MRIRSRFSSGSDPSFARVTGDDGLTRQEVLGRILVRLGRLTTEQAEYVYLHQKEFGLPFGETAVKLGIIDISELQFALGRQFEFPVLDRNADSVDKLVVSAFDPHHRIAKITRHLRTQILLNWTGPAHHARVLAVASVSRRDGRSVLAANLAVSFAQLGEETLLIDGDLRIPRQHSLFRNANQVGLSTVLSRRSGTDAIRRFAPIPSLSILYAGAVPPNPEELLGRNRLRDVLMDVGATYSVVIIDTSAAELGTDAQLVCRAAGNVLAIARKNRTRLAELKAFVQQLQTGGPGLLGMVMNEY